MDRTIAQRRLVVATMGSALLFTPLTMTTVSADEAVMVGQCVGSGSPDSSFGPIRHRFVLGDKTWKQTRDRPRFCRYSAGPAHLRVVWRDGAGSMKAMRERVAKASDRSGFHLGTLHRRGREFDDNLGDRTAVAEFSYRNRGRRIHVRAVGDEFSLLLVRAPQHTWKRWAGESARTAHRTMHRMAAMDAYAQ